MILRELPDPNSRSGGTGGVRPDHVIIHATTDRPYYYPRHAAPFLLVSNQVNTGHYTLNGRRVALSPRNFYVVNEGDEFSIQFEKQLARETLLILFSEDFIQRAFRATNSKHEVLLSDPLAPDKDAPRFAAVPFRMSAELSLLYALLNTGQTSGINDLITALVAAVTDVGRALDQKIESIAAIKRSTREELITRLMMAEEVMRDNRTKPLSVVEIARKVSMNEFHFIRLFKQVYKQTPYQYYQKIRLDEAHALLQSGRYNVTEVCYQLGFESIGSFSNLFKRTFGYSPSGLH